MAVTRSWPGLFKCVEDGFDRIDARRKTRSYQYNEAFIFDWNNYQTFKPSEQKLPEILNYLAEPSTLKDGLLTDESIEIALLCYKVGTFYNHIQRNPDLALPKLQIAERILNSESLAWVENHLAFSYQQKLAAAKKQNNSAEMALCAAQAMQYCEKVKTKYQNKSESYPVKILAFAYCVQALTEYELGQIEEALAHYRFALDKYENIGALDDQYARAKNRWAMMLAENNQFDKAEQAFKELEKYWTEKSDAPNPYPARFYVSYGELLSKATPHDLTMALDKFKKAYATLCKTEGEQAGFTQDIHQKILAVEEKLQQEKSATASANTVSPEFRRAGF